MSIKSTFPSITLDILIAILIALASLATALAVWRTNVVNSSASDTNRTGLIYAIESAAAQGEDWRKVYQEAGYGRDYLVELAAVTALETSADSSDAAFAANLRQYLIPNLASFSDPLGISPAYRQADGTFDIQKRFLELEAEDPDLAALDPPALFQQAERLHREQRFLTVGVILLAASLFWFGMAEISPGRARIAALVIGLLAFLLTLGYLTVVEAVFILLKGGLS
jgi:hypothetical protein